MLTEADFFKLDAIGLYFADHILTCYKQGDTKELLFKINTDDLLSIDLAKSGKKELSLKQLFGWWIAGNRDEPIHAAAVYTLTITLRN